MRAAISPPAVRTPVAEALSALFPGRPTRSISSLGQDVAPWTNAVVDPSRAPWRDMPVENPWVPAGLLGPEDWHDERHWLTMERDPAISGAMESRIMQLIHGGVEIEPGEGEGAEELFDFWRWALGELPLVSLTAWSLRSIFRGWEPVQVIYGWRDWKPSAGSDRRRVWVPVSVLQALSHQMRWTAGRDLIVQPHGIQTLGYRMQTLPARMKWFTPTIGGLGNPYGYPLHTGYLVMDFAFRQLTEAGLVQAKQAQGFLQVTDSLDVMSQLTAGQQAAADDAIKIIHDMIAKLQSSGILYNSGRFTVDWVALTSALEGWIKMFVWFGDVARSYYTGGNLTGAHSGSGGSRALSEVHERQQANRAAVDALRFGEEFRSKFLRPCSAWNAGTIAPAAFPPTAATPRVEDVPLAAVPRVTFPALARLRKEDLDVLAAILDAGVSEEDADGLGEEERRAQRLRVDVRAMLRNARIPLLEPGEEGPALDLARRQPPPAGFPHQASPGPADVGAEPDDDTPEPPDRDPSR